MPEAIPEREAVSTSGIEVEELAKDDFEHVVLEAPDGKSLDEVRQELETKIEMLKETLEPFNNKTLSGDEARQVEGYARELNAAESRLQMIDLNTKVANM